MVNTHLNRPQLHRIITLNKPGDGLSDRFNTSLTGVPTYTDKPKPDHRHHPRPPGQHFRNIYIFSGIALLILLIACVNYVNLTTARAIQRLPETGVRKVLGAARSQFIGQFLTESLCFFLISALLATLMYTACLPLAEHFLGHPLALATTRIQAAKTALANPADCLRSE